MQYLAFFLLDSDPTAAIVALMAIIPIIILVCLLIILIPFWFILKKAGFSPWLTLINIVPLGTMILLYVLAFSDWKVVPAPQPIWQQPQQPPYQPQA
jgi:branched-subunit amino acid transport protein AzlD